MAQLAKDSVLTKGAQVGAEVTALLRARYMKPPLKPGHWLYEHIARGKCAGCQWCDTQSSAAKASIRAIGPSLRPTGEFPVINGRVRSQLWAKVSPGREQA